MTYLEIIGTLLLPFCLRDGGGLPGRRTSPLRRAAPGVEHSVISAPESERRAGGEQGGETLTETVVEVGEEGVAAGQEDILEEIVAVESWDAD